MNEPEVAIIIVNWNGKNLLKDCLMSLRENTNYSNYKVIVVDNGSSDGSAEFLKTEFADIDGLILDENYGFAGGNNRGIVYALKRYDPDYILLLNNDTKIIQKDWLRRMVEVAEGDEEIGIAGCKLIYPDGKIQHIGMKIDRFGMSKLNPCAIDRLPDVFDIECVLGACFLVKRSLINKIGLLDENFSPFQHEEIDYCLRAKKAGYRICTVLDVKIIHILNASMKKTEAGYFALVNMKNWIRFMLLNFPVSWIVIRSIKIILTYLFKRKNKYRHYLLDLAVRKDWIDRSRILIEAFLINLKNLREILDKRRNRTKKIWYDYEDDYK